MLQRCPEATAHVQHALPVVHRGHVEEHLIEPLYGTLDVLRLWRLAGIEGWGLIPVP
jgi:hypothetical protein